MTDLVADLTAIRERIAGSWCQRRLRDRDGKVSIHGALAECVPEERHPAVIAALRAQLPPWSVGAVAGYQDRPSTTEGDVLVLINHAIEAAQ